VAISISQQTGEAIDGLTIDERERVMSMVARRFLEKSDGALTFEGNVEQVTLRAPSTRLERQDRVDGARSGWAVLLSFTADTDRTVVNRTQASYERALADGELPPLTFQDANQMAVNVEPGHGHALAPPSSTPSSAPTISPTSLTTSAEASAYAAVKAADSNGDGKVDLDESFAAGQLLEWVPCGISE
jgi:hypothetical protein